MQAPLPLKPILTASGAEALSLDLEAQHAGAASCTAHLRVGRFLQAMAAARELTDQEIRQHAADCAQLMEQAYSRFEATGNPADREEACLWMHRRDEAMRALSPAWKAAREAQIQQAIAESTGCYFIDSADAARAAISGRSA